MVLESLNPIGDDKPLKFFFFHLGGCSAPPNIPIFRFLWGFGGPQTPPKMKKNIIFKGLSFSMGFKLSRTIFIFDLQ